MESVFFDANPSLRQLTDNATRSSDQIQRAQQKESKKVKATKMTPVDSADLSTETEFMSNDMMGDMDPDQFRGRRSPSFFQQDDSAQDEEKKKGPEEENKSSTPVQGESFQKDGPAHISQASGGSVKPDTRQIEQQETQRIAGCEPGQQERIDTPQEEKASSRGMTAKGDGLASKQDISRDKRETIEVSRPQKESASSKSDPASSVKDENTKKDNTGTSSGRPSSHTSLLAWDDEFIIADPQKRDVMEEEAQCEAPSFESLDLPSDETDEEIRISQLLDDMMAAPVSEEIKYKICELLTPFGGRVMKLFHEFGSRILVLSRDQNLSAFIPPQFFRSPPDTCRDAYIPGLKLCVFAEEHIDGNDMPFITPRFYYAVAFDNALGKDDFASLKSAAVLSNYKSCLEGEPGHQFVDRFSSLSPVHYFAQAVESYLNEEKREQWLCCREELYDSDRSMFLYVEYLFREINRNYGSVSLKQRGE
ncbi:MAG: hypothetical protein AB9903_12810 [Vulcanimicrobiota bacterium]